MGAKKAVNVSIQSELLDAARTEDINLSATLEAALADQLRIRRRDRWRTENEAGIEAYNRDVDQNSSFGDHARSSWPAYLCGNSEPSSIVSQVSAVRPSAH